MPDEATEPTGKYPVEVRHELALNYTDTTGEVDRATGKANINKRIDITDSGFSSDGGTRLVVQTTPDG